MALEEMTWPEVDQAVKARKILFFSVGSIEQHGFHLPLGVDTYLPREICNRVARRLDGVVAPSVNYGYKSLYRSGGGPHFPGSIGLSGSTLIAVVKDIFREFLNQGWRRFVVLDWHLENVPFVYEGIDEALRSWPDRDSVTVIKIDNPNGLTVKSDPGLMEFLFGDDFPGWDAEHAAIWETSAMLAAAPELVREDQVRDGTPPEPVDYEVLPTPPRGQQDTGVFWKASMASAEKGRRILETASEAIVGILEKELKGE